jgi:hypothetical protein
MQLADNGFPRRCRIDLFTPAEAAIRAAVGVVEAAGAHPLLTDAVVLLQQAREKVADYVELTNSAPVSCANLPHSGSTAVDQEWRKTLVLGWRKEADALTPGEYWLRWTSPRGLYYWLHPTEGRWVGEPEQIKMPTFPTREAAWAATKYLEQPDLDESE